MLTDILNSHQSIVCEGELMHPGAPGRTYGAVEKPQIVWNIINNQRNVPFIGFKLSIQHFVDLNLDISTWMHLAKPEKIIFLYRENLIAQYASVLLASINNAWTSNDGNYNTNQVVIDLVKFEDFRKNIELANTILSSISDSFDGTKFSYEDIIENPTMSSNSILNYLGIDKSNFYSELDLNSLGFKKQRSKTLEDSVLNFKEVIGIYPELLKLKI